MSEKKKKILKSEIAKIFGQKTSCVTLNRDKSGGSLSLDSSVKFGFSELEKLSEYLGTRKINIDFEEGDGGWSEYTPGSSAYCSIVWFYEDAPSIVEQKILKKIIKKDCILYEDILELERVGADRQVVLLYSIRYYEGVIASGDMPEGSLHQVRKKIQLLRDELKSPEAEE